jgi:CelD/BcsL family acetyltransferase involved in cellulose biosynthesis
MQERTLNELSQHAAEIDRAAARTPEIDAFCSSTSWILPASAALMPPGTPWLYRGGGGYLLGMCRRHHGLRCVEPLEAGWGLACPLLGPDPAALVAALAELCARRHLDWDVLLLCGIPRGSSLFDHVVRALGTRHPLRLGPVTTRHVASLEGGLDGFLGRRSRSLRKGLRRAQRRARELGVTFEHRLARSELEADALYARVLAVEERSWKGRAGSGIVAPEMREFYRRMIRRLAAQGRQRTLFAVHDGQDIGYVLGGVLGDTYRGLQFSFDDAYRELALGNLCQLEQIAARCDEELRFYDLGTGLDYKQRWAEATRETVALIVMR